MLGLRHWRAMLPHFPPFSHCSALKPFFATGLTFNAEFLYITYNTIHKRVITHTSSVANAQVGEQFKIYLCLWQ